MKIAIILISSNDDLISEFMKKRQSLIPKEVYTSQYKDIGASFVTYTFKVSVGNEKTKLDNFIKEKIDKENIDCCLLMIENNLLFLINDIRNSLFTYILEWDGNISNAGNFLKKSSGKLVKGFRKILESMHDAIDISIMSLPIRNFHADELVEIVRLCREWDDLNQLSNDLKRNIYLIKKNRKRPKDRTGKKSLPKYIVDDNEHAFEYGHEEHGTAATGEPHKISCYIANNFRFGKRIDNKRHYNISLMSDEKIGGEFKCCHDDYCEVKPVTHINMFSNDYIR